MALRWDPRSLPPALTSCAPPLGLFVLQKAVFLVVAILQGHALADLVYGWDATHFLRIAEDGYSLPSPARPNSNLAMFPLLPMLTRTLATITPLNPPQSLIVIAWSGTLLAALGIFVFVRELTDGRVATIAVLLWGAAPHSFVQLLGYTEGAFTATVAWSLWALRRERWLLAGMIAGLGALLRSTGALLAITLAVYAVGLWLLSRRRAIGETSDSRPGWRELLRRLACTTLPGGLALAAVLLHVALRLGSLTGYFDVQRAWGTTLGSPLGTWREIAPYWSSTDPTMTPYTRDIGVILLVALVLVIALIGWGGSSRERWPMTFFTVGLYALTVCTLGYPQSKARFLLPGFGMWVPIAVALARLPTLVIALVIAGATAWSVHVDSGLAVGPWSP